MKQDINNLRVGQAMLVVKNEDDSFSPIYIRSSQAIMLNNLLCTFSESAPFIVNKEVKLVKN